MRPAGVESKKPQTGNKSQKALLFAQYFSPAESEKLINPLN